MLFKIKKNQQKFFAGSKIGDLVVYEFADKRLKQVKDYFNYRRNLKDFYKIRNLFEILEYFDKIHCDFDAINLIGIFFFYI